MLKQMRGGKLVKAKKLQRQDFLRFRANSQKLILGSIGTHLDHHLSGKCQIDIRRVGKLWKIRCVY